MNQIAQQGLISAVTRPRQGMLGAVAAAPWTFFLAAAAIFVSLSPTAASVLELQREAVTSGQLWRLITCHLTHFGANHLLWDVAMFVAVGWVCEHRWPRRTRISLIASAIAIGASVVAFVPDIGVYRGLSGVDSALFGLLATSLLLELRNRGDRHLVGLIWLSLAGFAAKLGYEVITASTVFVDSEAAAFAPVPLAHAIGFAIGVFSACLAHSGPTGIPRTVWYDRKRKGSRILSQQR